MDNIEKERNMLSTQANRRGCLCLKVLRVEKGSDDFIFGKILQRDLLEHESRVLIDVEVEGGDCREGL